MCRLDVDSILFSLSRSSRIIEIQPSNQISCSKPYSTWIPSKACRIWCNHKITSSPERPGRWCQLSCFEAWALHSVKQAGGVVAFGLHMYLWHTYHIALGIVTRLQRKLLIAVGSLWPCLANPTQLRQRQEQESPRNNCRLFYPDEIAGVFLNHEAGTIEQAVQPCRDVTKQCSFSLQMDESHKTNREHVAPRNNIHTIIPK